MLKKKFSKNKQQPNFKNAELFKNKDIDHIIYAQKQATENVLKARKYLFRSFEILKRDEKTLGELFTFLFQKQFCWVKLLKLILLTNLQQLIKTETKKYQLK